MATITTVDPFPGDFLLIATGAIRVIRRGALSRSPGTQMPPDAPTLASFDDTAGRIRPGSAPQNVLAA